MYKELDAYWMPFTANRQFKKAPRMLARSAGMHYWDDKGRQILDAVAGLWCVNAGHARPRICLLYTSPSPRDRQKSRMPSSA